MRLTSNFSFGATAHLVGAQRIDGLVGFRVQPVIADGLSGDCRLSLPPHCYEIPSTYPALTNPGFVE